MSFDKRVWKGAVFVSLLLIFTSANAAAWDPADMQNEMDETFETKFGDSSSSDIDIDFDHSDTQQNTETITRRTRALDDAPAWFPSTSGMSASDEDQTGATWVWSTSQMSDTGDSTADDRTAPDREAIDRDRDRDSGSDDDSEQSSDSSQSPSTPSGSTEQQAEEYLHQYINQERQERGIGSLNDDSGLQTTARAKSQDMADRGYFAHTSPSGENFRDLYNSNGVSCSRGGENLARTWYQRTVRSDSGSVNYDSPQELAEGLKRQWMGSSSHREAMLRSSYNQMGVGIEITSDGRVYATAHFCT